MVLLFMNCAASLRCWTRFGHQHVLC